MYIPDEGVAGTRSLLPTASYIITTHDFLTLHRRLP